MSGTLLFSGCSIWWFGPVQWRCLDVSICQFQPLPVRPVTTNCKTFLHTSLLIFMSVRYLHCYISLGWLLPCIIISISEIKTLQKLVAMDFGQSNLRTLWRAAWTGEQSQRQQRTIYYDSLLATWWQVILKICTQSGMSSFCLWEDSELRMLPVEVFSNTAQLCLINFVLLSVNF